MAYDYYIEKLRVSHVESACLNNSFECCKLSRHLDDTWFHHLTADEHTTIEEGPNDDSHIRIPQIWGIKSHQFSPKFGGRHFLSFDLTYKLKGNFTVWTKGLNLIKLGRIKELNLNDIPG